MYHRAPTPCCWHLHFLALIIGTSVFAIRVKSYSYSSSFQVDVDLLSSLHECDSTFLSLAIDSGLIKAKLAGFDVRSQKLQNLAKALSPCNIRLGGTNADFLTFDPDGKASTPLHWNKRDLLQKSHVAEGRLLDHGFWDDKEKKELTNFTMSGGEWHQLTKFFSLVGWDIMFDFNLFKWNGSLWDPTNAEELLQYSALQGYEIKAFQLGNEPNSFKHNFNFSISAATLVKDFYILKSVLPKYPQYMKNKLYGPDVTNLDRHSSSRIYLQDFIKAGGAHVVDEISLHHYYLNGRLAKAEDFYDVKVLDSLEKEFDIGHNISGGTPIRLTETSSCYGGGAPGLSDRFVAGFLWLDKLGLAAKHGVTKVFRQTFFRGHYALLSANMDPNPDYFLSLLHKQLIEGPVFNTTIDPDTREVRIYAHCTRASRLYRKGALTVAFLNTRKGSVNVTLAKFSASQLDLYILTPGDLAGLSSEFVKLNGKTLKMSGSSLPPLTPLAHKGEVTLPALSFGFIVVPDAKIALCVK